MAARTACPAHEDVAMSGDEDLGVECGQAPQRALEHGAVTVAEGRRDGGHDGVAAEQHAGVWVEHADGAWGMAGRIESRDTAPAQVELGLGLEGLGGPAQSMASSCSIVSPSRSAQASSWVRMYRPTSRPRVDRPTAEGGAAQRMIDVAVGVAQRDLVHGANDLAALRTAWHLGVVDAGVDGQRHPLAGDDAGLARGDLGVDDTATAGATIRCMGRVAG